MDFALITASVPVERALDLLWTMTLVAGGGGFGGMTAILVEFDDTSSVWRRQLDGGVAPPDPDPLLIQQWQSFPMGYCLRGALVGIAGALGAIAAAISVGQFPDSHSLQNDFFLLGGCVVAGFAGRRLLRGLGERLTKTVDEVVDRKWEQDVKPTVKQTVRKEVEQRVEDVKQQAERRGLEQQEESEVKEALRTADVALDAGGLPSDRRRALGMLLALNRPLERRVAILIGRIHRWDGNIDEAIRVLTNYIEAHKGDRDKDYADILYNRACYYALIAADARSSATDRERTKAQFYADLTESIGISPDNKADALVDTDFDKFREEPQFSALVGEPAN